MQECDLETTILAPFPHSFLKKHGDKLLVYGNTKSLLLELSGDIVHDLFASLVGGCPLSVAIDLLEEKVGRPADALMREISPLIAMLMDEGILVPKGSLEDCDVRRAYLDIVGQMPGHFLRYLGDECASHLETPLGIRFQLTAACVVGCPHCYLRGSANLSSDVGTADSIPPRIVMETVDELLPSGIGYVELSGGEPCLHPDFTDVCRDLLDRGLPVYVMTSGIGYDLQQKWEPLVTHSKKDQLFVQISIDGNVDVLSGPQRPGATSERIERCVRYLSENGICVHSNTVITRHNADHLRDIALWIESLGIERAMFSMCVPAGHFPNEALSQSLSVREYFRAKDQITSEITGLLTTTEAVATFLEFPFLASGAEDAFAIGGDISEPVSRRIMCGAGVLECTITPSGSLAPCAQLSPFEEYCDGDLHSTGIAELWHDADALAKVRDVSCEDECYECAFSSECSKGCHAHKRALEKPLSSPDPFCFLRRDSGVDWGLAGKSVPRS